MSDKNTTKNDRRERLLHREIKKLRKELKDAHDGVGELSRALDGIVTQVLVQCGNRTDRGFEVRITPVPLDELAYTLATYQDESEYIICAVPKDSRKEASFVG